MYSNLFITKDTPLGFLDVGYYLIDQNISPEEYYKIVKGAEWHLYNKRLSSTIFGNKILFLGTNLSPEASFQIGKYNFLLSKDSIKLNSKEHSHYLSNIVNNAFRRTASNFGYAGPESQKYYERTPYKRDFFAYYDSFYSDIEVFSDGRVGIWLDLTTKWKLFLEDLLSWAVRTKHEKINEYLLDKKVKCPSVTKFNSFDGKIIKILNISIGDFKFNNGTTIQSLYDFWTKTSSLHLNWLKRNKINLDYNDSPVIQVKVSYAKEPLSYPYKVLELVIDITDPLIPVKALFDEKKILPPRVRMQKAFELFDKILKSGINLGPITLNFERKLFDWSNENGNYGNIVYLDPPSLRFGKEGIAQSFDRLKDPNIKNTLKKYGPVTVKETIPVNYIVPEAIKDIIPIFNDYLNAHGIELKLGNFNIKQVIPIERIHPDRYSRTCMNLNKTKENEIAIIILPRENSTKAYFLSKKALGENLIRSQMIRWSTFNKLMTNMKTKKESPECYNLATKIYGKYLESGESIWHLKIPAGGIDPSKKVYYMGFDVSRSQDAKKEAAAYAAICDNYGRILHRNVIHSHRGEKVNSEVLSDWFWDVAVTTYDKLADKKPLDCLILFKDGQIRSSEVEPYKKGCLDAKSRLLNEGIMNADSDIKVVAVIKKSPYRLFGDEKNNYKVYNTGLIRNTRNALIVSSDPYKGTSSTIRLELAYQIIQDTDIQQILRIFNDLRFLDWSSIYKQPKTILPLHIVQNLAKLSKEDIILPYNPR